MPTYEYECKICGHHFEILQKMTDKLTEKCPKCSGAVKRLIGSGVGFIFKGSGFYITDHRSAKYQKAAETEKGNVLPAPTDKKPSGKPD